VKILLLLMVLSLISLIPFVVLRKPWALRLWRQLKLIIVVYAIIIAAAGILRLITSWDDIYG
jgi:glucose-6-phosphate-specific signal transduction histidine kinase